MEQTYTFTIQPSMLKPSGCGRLVAAPTKLRVFERLRSSGDTPSVSRSLDSSLREGAGDGYGSGYHSTGRPETATLRAIFIAPTKGGCHSTGCLRNRGGTGDFHRPYERRFPFIGVLGKREGLYRSMEIVSKWVQKSVRVHCSMGVLNIQLEIYFFQ